MAQNLAELGRLAEQQDRAYNGLVIRLLDTEYDFPEITDVLGHTYPAQKVPIPGTMLPIRYEIEDQYKPYDFEAPPVRVSLQPPVGATYPALELDCPTRRFRYWPRPVRPGRVCCGLVSARGGQTVPPEYRAKVRQLGNSSALARDRIEFHSFAEVDFAGMADAEAVEQRAMATMPGTLRIRQAVDPTKPLPYGFRLGTAGVMPTGIPRGPGLGGLGTWSGIHSDAGSDTEETSTEFVNDDARGIPRPRAVSVTDSRRLNQFLGEKFVMAANLYDGVVYYKTPSGEEKRLTPEEYMVRYQGNSGSCRNAQGVVEEGQWFLAFVPPHNLMADPIIDPSGELYPRMRVENSERRIARVFVPNSVLNEPVYRPHTFQVPSRARMLRAPEGDYPAVIVQAPGVWARFWYPAKLNQKVITEWAGMVLLPEKDRLELVSVHQPAELLVDENYQPVFGPLPERFPDPVPPPPLSDFRDPANGRMAPNKTIGMRRESDDPNESGTIYTVHFPPFLGRYHGQLVGGSVSYPHQFIVIKYPPKTIFIKDCELGPTYKPYPISTDIVSYKLRGVFPKKQRPQGPDGQPIKCLPDVTVNQPSQKYLYYFVPSFRGLRDRMDQEELRRLTIAGEYGARVRPAGKDLFDDNQYEQGIPERIDERDGTWFKIDFPNYGIVTTDWLVDRKGRRLDKYPKQRVLISPEPMLVRIPLTKNYMAWKIEPDDVTITLFTGDGKETEDVLFAPSLYDFYPPPRKESINTMVALVMSRQAAPDMRTLIDHGRGAKTLPEPRVGDTEPEIGLLGPLEPGEEEPFPPFAGMGSDQGQSSDDSSCDPGAQSAMHATQQNLTEIDVSNSGPESNTADQPRDRSQSAPAELEPDRRRLFAGHTPPPKRRQD
ncbi:hypothetical protein HDE_04972 [Halotydeus destructor]|nr:hypothetical protein HDE_04972 [Halotydeus destructor]